ncbi:hypothetical protein J1F00_05840 [Stenotrophomonas maltophilia]|nr:hypothetical protein [Stenotrophomonas maltophilia]
MARQVIDTTTDHGTYKGDAAKVAFEKTNANFAELYDSVASADRGQISPNGLLMSFAGSTLTVSPGAAFIPSLAKLLPLNAPASKTLSGMTPNTWYHVYLFAKTDGTADFEVVTTAPSAPYFGTARTKGADTTRRYLGSVRVGATGVLKFEHRGTQVFYLEDTQVAPFLVLAGGSSTAAVTVSASQVAPVTAYAVFLNALNAATNGAYVRLSNSKGPSAQTGYLALASPGGVAAVSLPVDAAQAYTYAFDNAPSPAASAYHRISGYLFER